FLINQSKEYGIAMAVGWTEYLVEVYFFPGLKSAWIRYLGLLMVAAGQTLRTTAMWTAGSNFTHIVQDNKRATHVLVTDGVYRFSRHPGYCGWFWWSVGTQVLLCNPVSTVLYALASYKFFVDRIEIEEEYLMEFFDGYKAYKQQVSTGIPFIA
ncbi:hypothetical protein, variant, partial [Sphaeroforma arctica JP610]